MQRINAAEFLAMLDGVKARGENQYMANCPAHNDLSASLSVRTEPDGKYQNFSVVFSCKAGCTADGVCHSLRIDKRQLLKRDLSFNDRIEKVYDYRDEQGNLLYQSVRLHSPKEFRQRGPDGRWKLENPRLVPYRLPELLAASPLTTVFVVEGEKDADRLASLGLVATTCVAGAGKWRTTDNSAFRGREVVIIPDNDQPGWRHAVDVANKLRGIAAEVRIVELPDVPEKGDVSDYLNAGKSVEDLNELVEHTSPYQYDQPKDQHDKAAPRMEPGTRVMAGDRGNIGTVIADEGESAAVRFVSKDGVTAEKSLPWSELKRLDGTAVDSTPFRLDLIDSASFAAAKYDQRYLINGVLVAGQPCIIGGAQKSMKTSTAIDLAFSLGTGTRFLNKFDVSRVHRVMVISGESGEFTLQETAKRVAWSRGKLLSDASIFWGFRLPQLGISEHLQAIADAVQEHGIEVAVIDPAYLCMLRGENGSAVNFANLFEVGSLLLRVSEVFSRVKCTPLILHHESKGAMNLRQNAPMELKDLSMSGFAEWARQWLLISRREAYEHGTGRHRLWLNAGGSAGHGGLWAVDVDEGIQNDEFTGRKWMVAVSTPHDAKASTTNQRTKKHRQQIIDAMRKYPDGQTERQLRMASKLNPSNFGAAWESILSEGLVEECVIQGRGKRTYEGFRLLEEAAEQRNNTAELELFLSM